MAVRNCAEIGENLQKIMQRLIANDDLVKLLYYTEPDPLSKPALTDEQKKKEIFNELIKIIPKVTAREDAKSTLAIRVDRGVHIGNNDEFTTISIYVELFVPFSSWFIKGTNLRPFAILGEIQKSLEGKTVNGLGKLSGGDFELSYLTDEFCSYATKYEIVSYA